MSADKETPLYVYKATDGSWWWDCSQPHEDDLDTFGKHDAHTEALAAAFTHCAKAGAA